MQTIDQFFISIDSKIKNILDECVFFNSNESTLKKAAAHLCVDAKSKKIRSNITYCFGNTMQNNIDDLLVIATGAELIHAASLLHDDVIDYGQTRRGKPTSNAIHGNTIAVLAGDFLYTVALECIQHLPPTVFYEAIQVVKKMTISASMEYQLRNSPTITIYDWEQIALGKTSCLFSWCAKVPAILQKNKKAEDIFSKSAQLIGYSFQLADDIKDFFASDIFGKELYSDIKNKNPNYVTIQAMQESPTIKDLILNLWDKMDTLENEEADVIIKHIGKEIYNSKAFTRSLEQLNTWMDEAIMSLSNNGYKELSKTIESLIDTIYHSLSPSIKQHINL